MDLHNVIVGPIITEKAMKEAGRGKFTFSVLRSANKTVIGKAVSAAFNVHVTAIQTVMVKGKRKRVGKKRTEVRDAVWKRAIVTLKKGEKIDIFEAAGTSTEA